MTATDNNVPRAGDAPDIAPAMNVDDSFGVIGGSGPWYRAGDACGCLEIPTRELPLLLGLGPASLMRYLELRGGEQPAAIMIPSLEVHHWLDLIPLITGIAYGAQASWHVLPVYLPAGGWSRIVRALDAVGMPPCADVLEAVAPIELTGGERLVLAGVTVDAHSAGGPGNAVALRLRDGHGMDLTYVAAGTTVCELEEFAKGTSTLIGAAPARDYPPMSQRRTWLQERYPSVEELAELAGRCGAGELALTQVPVEHEDLVDVATLLARIPVRVL